MNDELKNNIEDKPPFFGSWNKIYLLVFSVLVILILLFYLFAKAFS